MTDKEAMAMALDALEAMLKPRPNFEAHTAAIVALKERLAQPHETTLKEFNQLILDDPKYHIWAKEKEALADPMREVQRLGQEIEQEPVMILPDGSAFGVMSFPLPDDHWLYAPNEYKDGEYEPIDLPKPILTHELRDAVVAAVRYAVRGATMRGQETDFDPDALVQNAVYALCGPYTTPPAQPAQRTEQEPVAFASHGVVNWIADKQFQHEFDLYTTPPQRTWVGLTDEEREELTPHKGSSLYEYTYDDVLNILLLADAKLRSKNQ